MRIQTFFLLRGITRCYSEPRLQSLRVRASEFTTVETGTQHAENRHQRSRAQDEQGVMATANAHFAVRSAVRDERRSQRPERDAAMSSLPDLVPSMSHLVTSEGPREFKMLQTPQAMKRGRTGDVCDNTHCRCRRRQEMDQISKPSIYLLCVSTWPRQMLGWEQARQGKASRSGGCGSV
jgi:hypothetical protein